MTLRVERFSLDLPQAVKKYKEYVLEVVYRDVVRTYVHESFSRRLIHMAGTLRADVLFGFLIIYLVFYVKKSSFVVPDGVSIAVGKEDYITLNLLPAPVSGLQKEKEIINTLTRALYICCFYYVEILKHAQDPHKHVLACKISSKQRVFLFYIRTSEEWKEKRI